MALGALKKIGRRQANIDISVMKKYKCATGKDLCEPITTESI